MQTFPSKPNNQISQSRGIHKHQWKLGTVKNEECKLSPNIPHHGLDQLGGDRFKIRKGEINPLQDQQLEIWQTFIHCERPVQLGKAEDVLARQFLSLHLSLGAQSSLWRGRMRQLSLQSINFILGNLHLSLPLLLLKDC